MSDLQNRIQQEVKRLVYWLVEGEIEKIETYTSGLHLTAQMIGEAISEYPATLVKPPEEAFDRLKPIRIEASDSPEWYVCFDLWTAEEGRSDLSIECTVVAIASDRIRIELDGIHVL